MSEFEQAADPTPSQLRDIFSGPLGPMLGKMGVLSEEQQALSGQKQALMVAVRNAVELGYLEEADLPSFKGNVDFLGLAGMDDAQVSALLEKGQIDDKEMRLAQRIVDSSAGVNAPEETYKLPFIGQIHAKLHGNFEVSQAALTMQQAIRASDTALRLASGETDPGQFENKREFNFSNPNDLPETKNAVAVHKALAEIERDAVENTVAVFPEDAAHHLANVYGDAAKMFEDAGYTTLAENVRIVASKDPFLRLYGEEEDLDFDAKGADHSGFDGQEP